MKNFPKKSLLVAIFLGAASIAGTTLVHAQETTTTSIVPHSPQSLQSVESYSDTQLEELVNDLSATPLIWPTNAPNGGEGGTYWSLAHPEWPPLPGAFGTPFWNLTPSRTASAMSASAMSSDSTASTGSSGFYLLDDIDYPPSPGDGDTNSNGGYLPEFFGATPINTNLLWLQITNYDGNFAYLNLNNATDQVYAIWVTSNLLAGWGVQAELWPTVAQTNVMPFTVPALGQPSLFVRAEDWTGVTANGNTIPLWWLWLYFGNGGLGLSDNDLDSQGNTLLSDYEYGQDPNIISFSVSATNNYVNNANVPLQLNVTAGVPSYIAVLEDNTCFSDATWNAYTSSNIIVNLSGDQGWHTLCIGLRGLPSVAQPTWETIMLNLDTSPPLLVITNPINNTVAVPYIELQGYANEKLLSVTYAISNAFSIKTNLVGYLTGDEQSAANGPITNYFQCFDVALTNGPNLVTVTATDRGGNQTVTNLNFTLDYSSNTNPPAVAITWPQNGTQIGGTNFTLDGQVDDPTETVCASITDTNGDTNTLNGLVERNGKFWVERIPLNAGTNNLTLTVTNAAGNVTVTNICVVQSTITLTMDPVTPSSQLWQPTVNLTGEISDPTYAVWVNGVKGTNNGNGTWSANNVPTTSGGTASFTMTGYAPTEQQPDGSYGN